MEEKSTSTFKTGLTYGDILGLALIIYSVLLYVLDLNLNKYMGWISYIIIIGTIIYGTKKYRDDNLNGFISYGQALGLATIIVVFGALIHIIYTYFFISVIDPDYINKLLAATEEELLKKGMSDDQIEIAIAMQKKMMKPVLMTIMGFFGTVIVGVVLSLITSAFLKKEGDPFQTAMQDTEE